MVNEVWCDPRDQHSIPQARGYIEDLQFIVKIGVLLIGQIEPFTIVDLLIARSCPEGRFSRISPSIPIANEQEVEDTQSKTDDDGHLSGGVVRSILCTESLGAW